MGTYSFTLRIVVERKPTKFMFRPIRKIGVVLYALFMTLLQSHYITAQLYPHSEYFFGVWLGVSDAEVLSGLLLALCANVGLMLSPFLSTPNRAVRLLMLLSFAFGAILATISLVHIFSIHAFHPFWPSKPIDGIYIKMFSDSLISYSIDLFAIYLYLSRLRRLHVFGKRGLAKIPNDTGGSESCEA